MDKTYKTSTFEEGTTIEYLQGHGKKKHQISLAWSQQLAKTVFSMKKLSILYLMIVDFFADTDGGCLMVPIFPDRPKI